MYDAVQSIFDDHIDELHLVASNPYHLPYWLEPSLPTLDYLSQTFPYDESIMDIMSIDEPTDIVNTPQTPIFLQEIDSKGNLCSITQTNPIDISAKPGTLEHVHVGKNCSTYRALFKEF